MYAYISWWFSLWLCRCARCEAFSRLWILSWPWPRLCVLKRRLQHGRYSRNGQSRFFLLTAPSTAKSSHTIWLQKYYSHRHCCLCKHHKTLLPLPSLEVSCLVLILNGLLYVCMRNLCSALISLTFILTKFIIRDVLIMN